MDGKSIFIIEPFIQRCFFFIHSLLQLSKRQRAKEDEALFALVHDAFQQLIQFTHLLIHPNNVERWKNFQQRKEEEEGKEVLHANAKLKRHAIASASNNPLHQFNKAHFGSST